MESLFAAIDEMGDQAVLVSVPDMRIVHANRDYLAAVGIGLEEAKGLCCHSVSHHLDHPCDSDGHKCPVRIRRKPGIPLRLSTSTKGKTARKCLWTSPPALSGTVPGRSPMCWKSSVETTSREGYTKT